ncbi:MAG: biotin--[acetyl-CoA-carboxylase] ligase [Syntrophorhabdaceae bacterium]|nr:biotin--[acetyl-CoA-carboxylase] ligase [Syntrophorhabdaceae bacterium]
MDNLSEVLRHLRDASGFISGDHIAGRLGVSRTAVWKYMNQLERYGYDIDKSKGKGYRLIDTPDRLYGWEIDRYRSAGSIGSKIIHKDKLDSTNVFAFKQALAGEAEGVCVVAEAQEKGKGRLGRQWSSPQGKNIYLSVILRPSIHPSLVYPITFLSSLAVSDTIGELTGIKATLKWPNDVLVEGRKISGTLIELSTEADMVRFVVIGIGLNVNMGPEDMDKDIKAKATSLLMETKKIYERPRVCGILLSNLERYYGLFKKDGARAICDIWEERAQIRGKHLEINQMGEVFIGTARGIDRDGAILLDIMGVTKKILAGDVNF